MPYGEEHRKAVWGKLQARFDEGGLVNTTSSLLYLRGSNRTAHLDERKKMMQLWSDYLDEIKAGAKILSFPKMAG